MNTYRVINKASGEAVYRYDAEAPVPFNGMEFDTHDHVLTDPEPIAPEQVTINPLEWRIGIGAFFDRFGQYKIPILASDDLVVQAIVKDCSVRKYIDLYARRDEIQAALGILVTKGFPIDADAILDLMPSAEELFNG